MLTNKQLQFALGEAQTIQRKNFDGEKKVIITSGGNIDGFTVSILFGSIIETFEFCKSITEDQCVDYLQKIEKLVK